MWWSLHTKFCMLFLKECPLGPFILLHAPLWWIWLSAPQAHNNKSEAVIKRESVSHRQAGMLMVAIHENWECRKTRRRLSSVPLDGLILKACRSDFLSCLLRAVFFGTRIQFFLELLNFKLQDKPRNSQLPDNLAEIPPTGLSETFSKKKTIGHLADTHELIGSNHCFSKEFDSFNLNMKKPDLHATNGVLATKGGNDSCI